MVYINKVKVDTRSVLPCLRERRSPSDHARSPRCFVCCCCVSRRSILSVSSRFSSHTSLVRLKEAARAVNHSLRMAFDLFTPGHASSSTENQARASSSNAGDSIANEHIEAEDGNGGQEQGGVEVSYLRPQAFGHSDNAAWRKAEKSMGIAVSPTGGEVAAWVTKEVSSVKARPR